MYEGDEQLWAEGQFGRCDFGDRRLTKRVIDYAARQARNPAVSTHAVCKGNDAAAEGAYRMLRNIAVTPEKIEVSVFQETADECIKHPTLLAIQDTTGVSYPHSVKDKLGDLGASRGFYVHSTLMADAETGDPIGLIDQLRINRDDDRAGAESRRKRPYKEKESYRWQQSTERMIGRLLSTDNVITVCDREADIFEYLDYLTPRHRFVVRASRDRSLETAQRQLLWAFMEEQPVLGTKTVEIAQRGGQRGTTKQKKRAARPARTATLEIRAAVVKLRRPQTACREASKTISAAVVYLREVNPSEDEQQLEWMLLTSEPIATVAQIHTIVGYYERRWVIEDFHKSWKSGCNVETRRLQSPENLERLMVILAPIAVRLLQLRSAAQQRPKEPCDILLSTEEVQCLWVKTNPTKPLPKKRPTIRWAVQTIAKLGGWRDTKRTGRIGWITLWRGWREFQDIVEGWRLARQFYETSPPSTDVSGGTSM